MTTADRDLVESLRSELAAIDPPRRCCRQAELAGLADAARARRAVTRLVLRLRKDGPAAGATFSWAGSAEHCRAAYLRGRFLGHGSLSLASGRTHLEFVLDIGAAEGLTAQLAEMGLPASRRVRRGRGVVTWKSGETVGTFLRLIGGGASLLELEARQVSRSVRGDLNRVLNAESANLQRAVAAAARQLEAIETLAADGRLAAQPYLVRLVADARREEPEASFSDLAERLQIHRSAIQRALQRIERLALHPAEGGRRTGGGAAGSPSRRRAGAD